MTAWLPWILVAICFIDLGASVVLVRAARRPPRIGMLYERARAAVLSTLAFELLAALAVLAMHGIRLAEPWGWVIFIAALLLPGLIAPLFLADYLLGRLNGSSQ